MNGFGDNNVIKPTVLDLSRFNSRDGAKKPGYFPPTLLNFDASALFFLP